MMPRGMPALPSEAQAAGLRLAPAAGVMLQAVWFDAGAHAAGRLLLSIHHLAIDGVSWRILLPDLAAAWAAIAGGGMAQLPPSGTSLRRWAQRLALRRWMRAGLASSRLAWHAERPGAHAG